MLYKIQWEILSHLLTSHKPQIVYLCSFFQYHIFLCICTFYLYRRPTSKLLVDSSASPGLLQWTEMASSSYESDFCHHGFLEPSVAVHWFRWPLTSCQSMPRLVLFFTDSWGFPFPVKIQSLVQSPHHPLFKTKSSTINGIDHIQYVLFKIVCFHMGLSRKG